MTDRDKQATYNAEFIVRDLTERGGTIEVYGTNLLVPVERRFADLPSIQDYCDKVVALNWVKDLCPAVTPVRVRRRKGTRFAHYEGGTRTIAINDSRDGKWALREIVVLHELAHHLVRCGVRAELGQRQGAHGPAFRNTFVTLVKEIIGPEVGWLLEMEFSSIPVQTSPAMV